MGGQRNHNNRKKNEVKKCCDLNWYWPSRHDQIIDRSALRQHDCPFCPSFITQMDIHMNIYSYMHTEEQKYPHYDDYYEKFRVASEKVSAIQINKLTWRAPFIERCVYVMYAMYDGYQSGQWVLHSIDGRHRQINCDWNLNLVYIACAYLIVRYRDKISLSQII